MDSSYNNQYILVRKGMGIEERVVVLKNDNYIGRGFESSVCVLSLYISRQHCRLFCEEKKWFVEDDSSTNGTFINNKMITGYGKVEIKLGDYLGFGIDCYNYLENYNDCQSDQKYFVYQFTTVELCMASQNQVDGLCNAIDTMQMEE